MYEICKKRDYFLGSFFFYLILGLIGRSSVRAGGVVEVLMLQVYIFESGLLLASSEVGWRLDVSQAVLFSIAQERDGSVMVHVFSCLTVFAVGVIQSGVYAFSIIRLLFAIIDHFRSHSCIG